MDKFETVDQYIAALPPEQSEALSQLRSTIRAIVPEAAESISYGMPTYKYGGRPLIYFGAAKKHLAIYGTSAGTVHFQPETLPGDAFLLPLLEARMAEIEAARKRQRRIPAG